MRMNKGRVVNRKTFFSSDFHIGHKKIMEYCPISRKNAGNSCGKMKSLIIEGINSTVTADDVLYVLGDFAFTTNMHEVEAFLLSLNVKEIHLILGNHDQLIMGSKQLQSYFTSISNYREIRINSDLICLMHYPIEHWKNRPHGSYHLHGHLHSMNDERNEDVHQGEVRHIARRMDVGIDSRTDFKPWEWNEIKDFFQKRDGDIFK